MESEVAKRASELMSQLPIPAGPWAWRGYKDDVFLQTRATPWVYLMGTARSGWSGSQFCFQYSHGPDDGQLRKGNTDNLYVPRAPYARDTIADIKGPIPALIAMIPEMVEELQRLAALVEANRR